MNTSYVDSTQSRTSVSGPSPKLGKNTATLDNVAVVTNERGTSLQLDFKVGEKLFKTWVGEISKVWVKSKKRMDDDLSDPDTLAAYERESEFQKTHISSLLKVYGVTEEQIKEAYASMEPTMESWCNTMKNLFPSDYTTVSLDLFLQYQHEIKPGQDRNYLEIPKLSWEAGTIFCEHKGAGWTEYKDNGLYYKHSVSGETHPMSRNDFWLKGKNAQYQSIEREEDSENSEEAAPSSWLKGSA